MKHLLFILFLLIQVGSTLCAQNSDQEPATYLLVQEMPQFPGGKEALYLFIYRNTYYPLEAKKKGIEGKVYVRFIVDEKGTVVSEQVVLGIGFGCDEAALNAVKSMPDWEPGKQDGVPVRVQFTIPIYFIL